jgi:hypothetical protein
MRNKAQERWSMKEDGPEERTGPWLPVKQVPSEVHLDLLANKKCLLSFPNPSTKVKQLKLV